MASSSAVPISRAELNKTSIVLGYQNLNYETTANIMNTSSVGGTLTREEIQKFKQLKANLRATHFELGDAPMTYETSNKLADPTGNMSEYTAKLDIGAKRLLRQTSATLGYEHPTYETCTASATRWDKTKMLESIHQREASKKNNDPRKVNYDFGDEKTNYVSTSKDEFVYDAAKVQPAVLADAVKKGTFELSKP